MHDSAHVPPAHGRPPSLVKAQPRPCPPPPLRACHDVVILHDLAAAGPRGGSVHHHHLHTHPGAQVVGARGAWRGGSRAVPEDSPKHRSPPIRRTLLPPRHSPSTLSHLAGGLQVEAEVLLPAVLHQARQLHGREGSTARDDGVRGGAGGRQHRWQQPGFATSDACRHPGGQPGGADTRAGAGSPSRHVRQRLLAGLWPSTPRASLHPRPRLRASLSFPTCASEWMGWPLKRCTTPSRTPRVDS